MNSSNVLTCVTSVDNSQKSSESLLLSEANKFQKSSKQQQYSKTPSSNVLGNDYRLKNKNLLASIQTTSDDDDTSFFVSRQKDENNETNQPTSKCDMATSPADFLILSHRSSFNNDTKLFSDQSLADSTIVSSFNASYSSRHTTDRSLVRVSPPRSDQTNRLSYSRMSQRSDSKIEMSNVNEKKWQALANNYASRIQQPKEPKISLNDASSDTHCMNESEYSESDTEYLVPTNDNIRNIMRKSMEKSKKLSNENILNLITAGCTNSSEINEANLK